MSIPVIYAPLNVTFTTSDDPIQPCGGAGITIQNAATGGTVAPYSSSSYPYTTATGLISTLTTNPAGAINVWVPEGIYIVTLAAGSEGETSWPSMTVQITVINGSGTYVLGGSGGSGAAAINLGNVAGQLTGAWPTLDLASGAASSNIGALTGDISGTLPATTVSKLQGTALSASSPATHTALFYNGTNWVATGTLTQLTEVAATTIATSALDISVSSGSGIINLENGTGKLVNLLIDSSGDFIIQNYTSSAYQNVLSIPVGTTNVNVVGQLSSGSVSTSGITATTLTASGLVSTTGELEGQTLVTTEGATIGGNLVVDGTTTFAENVTANAPIDALVGLVVDNGFYSNGTAQFNDGLTVLTGTTTTGAINSSGQISSATLNTSGIANIAGNTLGSPGSQSGLITWNTFPTTDHGGTSYTSNAYYTQTAEGMIVFKGYISLNMGGEQVVLGTMPTGYCPANIGTGRAAFPVVAYTDGESESVIYELDIYASNAGLLPNNIILRVVNTNQSGITQVYLDGVSYFPET